MFSLVGCEVATAGGRYAAHPGGAPIRFLSADRAQSSPMPNIASIFKSEIARIARKEVRAETEALKKASAQYRSHIASLKRDLDALQQHVKQLSKGAGRKQGEASPAESEPDRQIRYSAKRLAAHRAKLGLSAKDYGALLGVSALSVYNWEAGKVRPRAGQLPAIAAVRDMSKKEAAVRLATLAEQ